MVVILPLCIDRLYQNFQKHQEGPLRKKMLETTSRRYLLVIALSMVRRNFYGIRDVGSARKFRKHQIVIEIQRRPSK